MKSSEISITKVSVDLVRWQLKMKRQHGVGGVQETFPGAILQIQTDAGITGWGEVAPWSVFTGTAEGNVAAIVHYARDLLIGQDPMPISALMASIDKVVTGHPEAKAAIEMALLDIVGKRYGLSVTQLFGGAYRSHVPLSVTIANPDFDADIDFAKRVSAMGYNIFKVKTGFAGHAQDLKRLERLREILPDSADIRVDYNQGLDPLNAIRTLRDIECFNLTFIEQPVKRFQWAAMAEFARAIDTPIMADESVFSAFDALAMVESRFADAVAIKLMKSGGITKAREIAAIAEAAGIAAYGGVMFEGGLACAAGLHTAASTPNISLGAEFYSSTWVLATEILVEPLVIESGQSVVPTGPGLGVTVDEAAVKSISVAHYS
jgi:muconate cycloisomerase